MIVARFAALATLALAVCCSRVEPDPAQRLNVLFILVDDLAPRLGCYGSTDVHTPAMDGLAARGVIFTRAYAQQARCISSRASMLSGRRPASTGVHALGDRYRDALPDAIVLPELFRRAGYDTRAFGKVEHGRGELDDARSWSVDPWRPESWQTSYFSPAAQHAEGRAFAFEAPDVPDAELPDAQIAARAIEFLEDAGDRPFFLAVGFLKPHLPFVAPRAYWDAVPAQSLVPAPAPRPPLGAPPWTTHDSGELRAFADVPDEGELGAELQRDLLRGYCASVGFVDAQIGSVLDALERLELDRRTVVVLWGDHGYHLGDLGVWGKSTLFESALRTPLVVVTPGGLSAARCDALVEGVDLYPTLAELCGLRAPAQLEGLSFAPLLVDPARPWKRAAFGEARGAVPKFGYLRGLTARTATHRVTEWTGEGLAEPSLELYDLRATEHELENLAGRPEHAELEREMVEILHAGWRAAAPR